MSSTIKSPRNWLCVAAFGAAFWITLRVMAASSPAPASSAEPAAGGIASSSTYEIRDPALELMIGRFARAARASER